jgi:hypothetical protein
MRLSILMCAYNEERTVARAISEVLGAHYPCDVELVVVDDGSADATSEILVGTNDPRVIIHRHTENQGKGAALCRYSLFGIAARLLPFGPLVRLLHVVMPWTRGQVEFSVHYEHCYPEAPEAEFRAPGFSDVRTWITWAQPGYFEAAYPFFSCMPFTR